MKQAVIDVMENNMSYRESSERHEVKKSSVYNYAKVALENKGLNNV